MSDWDARSFTKITLAVNSLEELIEIHNKFLERGFAVKLINDNGWTVFDGVETTTRLAL